MARPPAPRSPPHRLCPTTRTSSYRLALYHNASSRVAQAERGTHAELLAGDNAGGYRALVEAQINIGGGSPVPAAADK